MAPINTNNNNAVVADSHFSALALQMAQGQVGQSEKPIGSNSGPMVNEYLQSVGLNPGYPWCQAFVYWCFEEAAKKLGRPNPMIKTGGVQDCWNHSGAVSSSTNHAITKVTKEEALSKPDLIIPGTQFILLFGTTGHTGIVEKAEISAADANGIRTAILHTIEGNSNSNGGREGFEVVRHKRNINDKFLTGFLKYN